MNREDLIRARVARVMDALVSVELHPINLDPYPGTVDEVADEIARFVMELEDGPARGVAAKVRDRLERRDVEQIEAERTMLSPEDLF